LYKPIILIILFFSLFCIFVQEEHLKQKKYSSYELELERWNIYNDGTHPTETTRGFNEAIKWAKGKGYNELIVPDGKYLIAKGNKENDTDSRINLLSDLNFILDKNAIFQKETNSFEVYSILYLGPHVSNVTIKGGTFKGDRETHDYSKVGEFTSGTHEWGYGIQIAGSENITIDNVKLEEFTGDGIIVTATTVTGSQINEDSLELGSIDKNGELILKDGKIRTNLREVTNFDNEAYTKYRNLYFWLPEGIDLSSKVDVFYYRKDRSFIKFDKHLIFYTGESIIPKEADYFRAVFSAPSPIGVKVNRMTVDISKNITIQNCDIGYNRRQGISLVGSENVTIINNHIHHTNGTAPQSGIDIEPGYFPGKNTVIKGNTFTNNKIQIVLAYGENVKIEENIFNQSIEGGVGVYAHEGFKGDVILKGNTFNQSDLTLHSKNAIVSKNSFTSSKISLYGTGITFSRAQIIDGSLNVGFADKQHIREVKIKNKESEVVPLYFDSQPIQMKNVSITSDALEESLLSGVGNNMSIIDNLVLKNKNNKGTLLPAGYYKNCNFQVGALEINREGKYVLDNCKVISTENLLKVNSLYGTPDILVLNSNLEILGDIGYGAAFYIQEADKFQLRNSKVSALNNTENIPLIKIGTYGSSKPTNVSVVSIVGNIFIAKKTITGIDTLNVREDSAKYEIVDNHLINVVLKLRSKDINIDNTIE
jgi:parallel beta-helix repeat protein